MTTLTHTHTPRKEAISTIYGMGVDTQYTFCENCEQNIERDYFYDDYDVLPYFTKWVISK